MSRNGSRPHWDGWLTIATIAVALASAWVWADAEAAPSTPPAVVH